MIWCATILVVAAAGCLEAHAPAPSDGVDDKTRSQSPEETRPGAAAATVAPAHQQQLNTTMRLDDCAGFFGNSEIPFETAYAVVPSDFEPRGLTPDTAMLGYGGFACPTGLQGTAPLADVSIFLIMIRADPANESWDLPGIHWYVLELVLDGAEFLLGTQSVEGDFSYSNVTGLDRWHVEAPRIALDVEVPYSGVPQSIDYDSNAHYWIGKGPFHRVPTYSEYTYDEAGPVPGILRVDGSGPAAEAASPATASIIGYVPTLDYVWTLDWALRYDAKENPK